MKREYTRAVGKGPFARKKGDVFDFDLTTWRAEEKTAGAPLHTFSRPLEELAVRKGDVWPPATAKKES